MGRPALINRTGRFSNSAALTELKAGKTFGTYTYILNPYQTFENTGPIESGQQDLILNHS